PALAEQGVAGGAVLGEQLLAARRVRGALPELDLQPPDAGHLLAGRLLANLAPMLDDELIDRLVLEVEYGPELLDRDRLGVELLVLDLLQHGEGRGRSGEKDTERLLPQPAGELGEGGAQLLTDLRVTITLSGRKSGPADRVRLALAEQADQDRQRFCSTDLAEELDQLELVGVRP